MAENRVEILVTSRNDTKGGFESAKRDAEKAGDDAGKGFVDKFNSWLYGHETKGLFGNQGAGGGIGGIISTAFSAGPAGIGGLAAAAGALLVELDGLVSGFAAAGAGAGAFFLLSHNYVSNLTQDYSNIQSAIEKVQTAQNKYQLDPTKANLAALQKAQLNQQVAYLSAQQDLGTAAAPMERLAAAFLKIQDAFQPTVMKVFTDLLGVLNNLLPTVLPLANAFAGALDGLLKRAAAFLQSPGFQRWFDQFLSLVGPSTTAIGNGIGKVMVALGGLFTVMSKKDVVNSINIAFTVLAFTIQQIGGYIKILMTVWDYTWHAIEQAFITSVGFILQAAVNAFGWIPGLGPQLKTAQQQFSVFAAGVQGNLDTVSTSAVHTMGALTGVISAAANAARVALGGGGAGPGSGKVGQISRRAAGGPGSGWTIVGEQGPELVDLPSGSYVHPAGSFGGGGGGSQIVMNWGSPRTRELVRAIWPDFMLEVRNRGGGGPKSAQIALGQTH